MSLFFQFIMVFLQLVYKNTQNHKITVFLLCNYSIPQIMKHLQAINPLFFSVLILWCFTNCSKEDMGSNEDVTSITVKLKSTIGELDDVYIDIEDVQFKVKEDDNAPNAWMSLGAINHGTHNACNLNDDVPLLLVDHVEIESTFIHEIRLVLGDNNFIAVNGLLMGLDTSNHGNSKPSNLIKTNLVSNRSYEFVIDLDIDKSVSFDEDENMMILNPKIYTAVRQFEY